MDKPLTWDVLDKLSMGDIRRTLVEHGVMGVRGVSTQCPLARATGWEVDGIYRWTNPDLTGPIDLYRLTDSERAFVEEFDAGKFPELACEPVKDDE